MLILFPWEVSIWAGGGNWVRGLTEEALCFSEAEAEAEAGEGETLVMGSRGEREEVDFSCSWVAMLGWIVG